MPNDYEITRMTPEEMALALQWATWEGWNPGIHDDLCFYKVDALGFFAGKLNGNIIAMGSAVVYDENFAYLGFYRVDPIYRKQGYGRELTRIRMEYIGERNAGVDGVPVLQKKYETMGYHFSHKNARYSMQSIPLIEPISSHISPLKPEHFDLLAAYDRLHFPAPRTAFLECWIQQPEGLALGWFVNGELKGYGVIRACVQGFKIAPLFADSSQIAEKLFQALAYHAKGNIIYMDIPENNPHALALVEHFNMKKHFETLRMYLKGAPNLPVEHIFAITSFQLG